MNDPKADKAETKPLVKISNKVIEIEEYELTMNKSTLNKTIFLKK